MKGGRLGGARGFGGAAPPRHGVVVAPRPGMLGGLLAFAGFEEIEEGSHETRLHFGLLLLGLAQLLLHSLLGGRRGGVGTPKGQSRRGGLGGGGDGDGGQGGAFGRRHLGGFGEGEFDLGGGGEKEKAGGGSGL